MDVNLSAAIQLGTIVEHHWKFKNDKQAKEITVEGFEYIILPESDK